MNRAWAFMLGWGLVACGDSTGTGATGAGASGEGASSSGGGASGGGGGVEDGGASPTGGGGQGQGGSSNESSAIIAVGYGGLRVVSLDEGLTWTDAQSIAPNGGDDENLLRAIVWGNHLWIATGWHYMTSVDGYSWSDAGKLADNGILPCNIVEGLAFFQGAFYATCPTYQPGGNGAVTAIFRSEDGLTWGDAVSVIGLTDQTTGGHVFMTTAEDKLVVWGDTGTTYTSVDGETFEEAVGIVAGINCEGVLESMSECDPTAVGNGYFGGVSYFDGVWLKGEWQGKIVRSTDGQTYQQVYDNPDMNTAYRGTAFARGIASVTD